jgi:hypothetical protein
MLPLRALLPYARRGRRSAETAARCELCSAPVGDKHAHVVELEAHELRCACSACAVLFRDGLSRFRTVPDRVMTLRTADDADWARLEVPVQLAFLVRRGGWVAVYPSPAGPVEAPLSAEASASLEALVPGARKVAEEVEAIFLSRPRGGRVRCFLVPIDACYELVGHVRRTWRGFDGGDQAHEAIDAFVARLETVAKKELR